MVEQILMNLTPENVASSILTLTRMISALGGLIILYLIFGIVNLIISLKKNKELKEISENLKKILKILSKTGKK